MKHFIAFAVAISSTAFGSPIPDADPVRVLPATWKFDITSLKGPGCPQRPDSEIYTTRPTYGSNTVDGSEIYYWHFAYPDLRAKIGGNAKESEAYTWCETTLSYRELTKWEVDHTIPSDKPGYRLRVHKNGTQIEAIHNLEEGVSAQWKFTYYTPDDDEVIDTLSINGPVDTDVYATTPVRKELQLFKSPECGKATIKFRTELKLVSTKKGAKGEVTSERVSYNGTEGFYGGQVGVSYDFEECR